MATTPPKSAAEKIRGWLDADPDAELFEFPADWLHELLAEREQLVSDRARYRIAWRRARTRAISAGGAADRYAKRASDLQAALFDMMTGDFFELLAALTAEECETDDYGNCATHSVLALEPGGQCPHVTSRAFLALVWPTSPSERKS